MRWFKALACNAGDPSLIHVFHIHDGILLSHKKEQNNAICCNMDEPRGYHAEWSKSDRERQIPDDIIHIWNLKKWYKWTYLKQKCTHRHRKQTYGYQRGKEGGIN